MQAFILKKTQFGETNEVVTLYSRDQGKFRAVAKAVKSPKSRLAFALQPLYLTDVELLPSKNMQLIVGVKQVSSFKNINENLGAIYPAMYATEILLKSTADEQPNSELFDLYKKFLEHLDSSAAQPDHLCVDSFALKAMALNGYALNGNLKNASPAVREFAANYDLSFDSADLRVLPQKEVRNFVDTYVSEILERNLNSSRYLAKL